AYPSDNMTWEDMAALSAKVTRVDNGVQFYGYSTSISHMVRMNQLSLPSVVAGTDHPTINRDPRWKTWFENVVLNPTEPYKDDARQRKRVPNHTNEFLKTQNLAMFTYLTTLLSTYENELKAMNWDM